MSVTIPFQRPRTPPSWLYVSKTATTTKGAVEEAVAGGVDLRGAHLVGADLSGCDFNGCNLVGVDFTDADLSGANLSGAVLARTVFRRADLKGANFTGSHLWLTNFSGADLSGATGLPAAPTLENPDRQTLEALRKGGVLDMDSYHTCGSTHCLAGWLVDLAGMAGYRLEEEVGSNAAAALIYSASCPGRRVPDFFAPAGIAMAALEQRAAL